MIHTMHAHMVVGLLQSCAQQVLHSHWLTVTMRGSNDTQGGKASSYPAVVFSLAPIYRETSELRTLWDLINLSLVQRLTLFH